MNVPLILRSLMPFLRIGLLDWMRCVSRPFPSALSCAQTKMTFHESCRIGLFPKVLQSAVFWTTARLWRRISALMKQATSALQFSPIRIRVNVVWAASFSGYAKLKPTKAYQCKGSQQPVNFRVAWAKLMPRLQI